MNQGDVPLRRLTDRVAQAAASGTSLDLRGGGSKAFYGNAPRGATLDVRELCGVTSYEPTELVVTVLAGTPLAELERLLAERGQCLPFEPPHFGDGATVGGMVAAGLAGPGRAAAGPVRDFVLGATLLNGRAELLTFGGQVMKNVAGYDLSRLFAGSWGILGVLCEVSLKVMPIPPGCATVSLELAEADALRQVWAWSRVAPVTASAWHRGRLTVRFAGAEAAVRRAVRTAGGREWDRGEASRWWADVRDQRHEFFTLSDHDLQEGLKLWRIAVPATTPSLALGGETFVEWDGAQRWCRGTAADGEVRAVAAAAGGHSTLVRAADKPAGAFTPPAPASMRVHERLKQAFDPAGIFNPGRLYPNL